MLWLIMYYIWHVEISREAIMATSSTKWLRYAQFKCMSYSYLYLHTQDERAGLEYTEITGSLNHLAVYSRPDIAFVVSTLSQFNSDPTMTHMRTARHVPC